MALALIAIPLLLIAIMYLLFFRPPLNVKSKQFSEPTAEAVTLEDRVRRRMKKST